MLSTHNSIISSNRLSKEGHTIIIIFIACLLPVTPTPTRIQASVGEWFSSGSKSPASRSVPGTELALDTLDQPLTTHFTDEKTKA